MLTRSSLLKKEKEKKKRKLEVIGEKAMNGDVKNNKEMILIKKRNKE